MLRLLSPGPSSAMQLTEEQQRITAALTARDLRSDALAELIVETEAAIAAAEKAAEAERAKSLNLLQSPDADAAHAAMQSAEFAVERLRSVLPKLQRRHVPVASAEEYALRSDIRCA